MKFGVRSIGSEGPHVLGMVMFGAIFGSILYFAHHDITVGFFIALFIGGAIGSFVALYSQSTLKECLARSFVSFAIFLLTAFLASHALQLYLI